MKAEPAHQEDGSTGGQPAPGTVALLVALDALGLTSSTRAARSLGLHPLCVPTGAAAFDAVHSLATALAVVGVRVPDLPARDVVHHLARVAAVPVVVVGEPIAVADAVAFMRGGAHDCLETSAGENALRGALEAAVAARGADGGRELDVQRLLFFSRYEDIFRRTGVMRELETTIVRAVGVDVPVLFRGEPGVGKEFLARAMHYLSAASDGPFVKVSCRARPRQALSKELFTGDQSAAAAWDRARRGTLFVAHVDEADLETRQELGRRLTGKEERPRIVTSATIDARTAAVSAAFSDPLFARLPLVIDVPPLRDRRDEIPLLVRHFVDRYARQFARPVTPLPQPFLELFAAYDWPANVDELEQMVKRWIVFGSETDLRREIEMRRAARTAPVQQARGLRDIGRSAARAAEREALVAALARAHGNRAAAARDLKVSYKTLLQKLAATGLRGDDVAP